MFTVFVMNAGLDAAEAPKQSKNQLFPSEVLLEFENVLSILF